MRKGHEQHRNSRKPLQLKPEDVLLFDWFSGFGRLTSARILVNAAGVTQFQRWTSPESATFGQIPLSETEALILLDMVDGFGPLLQHPTVDDIGWSSVHFWRDGVAVESAFPLEAIPVFGVQIPGHLEAGASIVKRLWDQSLRLPGTDHVVRPRQS